MNSIFTLYRCCQTCWDFTAFFHFLYFLNPYSSTRVALYLISWMCIHFCSWNSQRYVKAPRIHFKRHSLRPYPPVTSLLGNSVPVFPDPSIQLHSSESYHWPCTFYFGLSFQTVFPDPSVQLHSSESYHLACTFYFGLSFQSAISLTCLR